MTDRGVSRSAPAARPAAAKLRNYGRRLLQPRYWPQLWRLAYRRVTRESLDQHTAAEAEARCRAEALAPADALVRLGFRADDLRSFRGDHGDLLGAAEERARAAARMGGGADLDLLYSLCVAARPRNVLETGVAFGWSSLAILAALSGVSGARLVSIDLPYLGADLDHVVGMAVPEALRGAWRLKRGADREELGPALGETAPLELAHYDSDKSYCGRAWAYEQIYAALAPGGVLMSDDIQDNLAFLAFAETHALAPVVVQAAGSDKFVGIVRRPG